MTTNDERRTTNDDSSFDDGDGRWGFFAKKVWMELLCVSVRTARLDKAAVSQRPGSKSGLCPSIRSFVSHPPAKQNICTE